jgi:hypothetical protein
MSYQVNYIDHKSILVVNPNGKLRRLEVPFRVYEVGAHSSPKRMHEVQEVLFTERDEIVYVINSRPYFHHHFAIEFQF